MNSELIMLINKLILLISELIMLINELIMLIVQFMVMVINPPVLVINLFISQIMTKVMSKKKLYSCLHFPPFLQMKRRECSKQTEQKNGV